MIVLALIGTGRFGQRYITTIKDLQGVQLKYICTSDEKKQKLFSPTFTVVMDYRELVQYQDIDGVIVCTPTSTHHVIASFFLKEGKNILIEKPLATSYQKAKRLLSLWQEKMPIVLVGHIYLYHPAFKKLLEQKRKVGIIRKMNFYGASWGPFRSDATTLWDWSPHDIAMCLVLMDTMPVAVEARGAHVVESDQVENHDKVSIHLYFPSGAIAVIHNSRVSPEKIRKATVIGDSGSVIFNDMTDDKITFFPGKGTLHVDEKNDRGISIPFNKIQPLAAEVSAFANSIRKNRHPFSDIRLGVDVVRVLQTAEVSLARQKKIPVLKE